MPRSFSPSFLYEAPEDGGGGIAPEAPAPSEPIGGEPVSSEPVAATSWSGPSEDEWYETQSLLRSLADRFSGDPAPGYEAPAESWEFDPLADDAGEQLAGLLSARDEFLLQRFQEMLGPVVQHTREQATQEAESRAMDVLADIESREGAFAEGGRAIARRLADFHFGQAQQRFGNTPRAAEYALGQAASELRGFIQREREAAVNEYKASLSSVAGAPNEPGAQSTGALGVVDGAENEMDVVARMFGTTVSV